MPADLSPEFVLGQLERGRLAPFYLFYGPGEFRLEKILSRIRETFVPEDARDLNLRIFYGDSAGPGEIMDAARSVPFLAPHRLIIVRRTENLSSGALESLVPYLEGPVETTCLIFVSSKADFKKKFYKTMRSLGRAVNFKKLYDNQVLPWIKKMARELGLDMEEGACIHLHEIVGNRLRDLHSELEKLRLRYGDRPIGVKEIKELATYSRMHTIFELMDQISLRRRSQSLSVLHKFLEDEGADAALGILGMLNRQIKFLFHTKYLVEEGGRPADVAKELKIQSFLANKIVQQSRHWSKNDLETAISSLYRADGLLKSGSQPQIVLESLVLSL